MTEISPSQATLRAALSRMAAAISARPVLSRWLLAGPGAVAAALLFTMAMPFWVPAGAAGVNNIAFPVILAPLIWAIWFTYACTDDNLPRAVAVVAGASVICGLPVALAMGGLL